MNTNRYCYVNKNGLKWYPNKVDNYIFKIPVGYAIFRRTSTGQLCSLADTGRSLTWSTNVAYIWQTVNKSYFKPHLGHFIVKTTRFHSDIEFVKLANGRSNYLWKQKSNQS